MTRYEWGFLWLGMAVGIIIDRAFLWLESLVVKWCGKKQAQWEKEDKAPQ